MVAVDLLSPFSRAQCLQRLRERVAHRFAQHGLVIGHVAESGVRLERRIAYRNSFGTQLRARLVSEGQGTRIHCRIGLHPLVFAILAFWIAMVGGAFIYTAVVNPRAAHIPLLMLCCAGALVGVGRYAARGDKDFLLDFLTEALQARILSASVAQERVR